MQVPAEYRQISDLLPAWEGASYEWDQPDSELAPSQELRAKVLDTLLRAAAFETGKVESLYESDAGVTLLVAEARPGWEAAVEDAGARGAFEDQYAAYCAIRDYAAEPDFPLGASFVCQLHSIACADQETLENGREFKKGVFKTDVNMARDRFGRLHEYCPPAMVRSELSNAFDFYNLLLEGDSSGVVPSAFLHWAVAHVHPFEDGNGRVARLMASIPTLAKRQYPVMVFADRKFPYLQALDDADKGDPVGIINYTGERLREMSRWAANLYAVGMSEYQQVNLLEELHLLLKAQPEPGESIDEILERVRASFGQALQMEFGDLDRISAKLRLSKESAYHTSSKQSTALGVSLTITDPISVAVMEKYTIISSLQPHRNIEIWTGSMMTEKLEHSIRYADCTPSLSTEARLALTPFAQLQSSELTRRLSREAKVMAEARGTRPSQDADTPRGFEV
ncbi:Fic/DOC family protein [Clavibacter michiganensis]|uniref:Fic/DOC family protein n=2 Tax=Clavibacter michiganensis TaxID=28447 RepID=A0A251YNM2_9MICO|nr:Fic/DOC family protein [Clavibacter michiganensis]